MSFNNVVLAKQSVQSSVNRIAFNFVKIVALFASILLCGFAYSDVTVEFRVDMSAETVHPDGVYLAGGDLGQDGYLMSDIGNNIYSKTLTLANNTRYMYKFRNQPSYGTLSLIHI